MDKVWAHRLDSGLSGYGGSDTWEAFVLLERITYGETVCICKRLHQRNIAALDLLERGSSEFMMMNLLEILAVEPIVVEPIVARRVSQNHKVVSKIPRHLMWQFEQTVVAVVAVVVVSTSTLGLIVQHLLDPLPLALVSRRAATQAGWY